MSRILTLLILVVLLSPLALTKTPNLPRIQPETHPPAMAQTPPEQAVQTAVIESEYVEPTPTPTPTPQPSSSPTPAPLSNTSSGYMDEETIRGIITKWATHYGVDPGWLLRVAECESSMNPANINPYYSAGGGNPTGLFQYLPQTWASFAEKAGLPGANIWDVEAQAQVTAWAFANGLAHNWECN